MINTTFEDLVEEKKLVIMRGLPGSGKSTLAKKIAGKKGVALAADDYFMRDGKYTFDANKHTAAHAWNQERAKKHLAAGVSPVVIDNTNTTKRAMDPYVKMGKGAGYKVQVRTPKTPWALDVDTLTKKNTHGVPRDAIQRMKDQLTGGK